MAWARYKRLRGKLVSVCVRNHATVSHTGLNFRLRLSSVNEVLVQLAGREPDRKVVKQRFLSNACREIDSAGSKLAGGQWESNNRMLNGKFESTERHLLIR